MIEYVEEAGKTMLCDVITGANCDEKSATFIAKMKAKSADEQQAYIDRLVGMEGNDMKDDLKSWLKTRKRILKNLLKVGDGDGDGASAEFQVALGKTTMYIRESIYQEEDCILSVTDFWNDAAHPYFIYYFDGVWLKKRQQR